MAEIPDPTRPNVDSLKRVVEEAERKINDLRSIIGSTPEGSLESTLDGLDFHLGLNPFVQMIDAMDRINDILMHAYGIHRVEAAERELQAARESLKKFGWRGGE